MKPDIRLSAEMSAEVAKANGREPKLGDVLTVRGFDGKDRDYVITEVQNGCIAGARLERREQ